MFAVDVIVGGETYSLKGGDLCYFVGQDGLGMSPLHRLSERGPQQHGESDNGFRLDPRIFRLFLDVPGESAQDIYDRRDDLLRILAPQNSPTVRFTLDNGDVRSIDAHVVGDLTFPSASRHGFLERAAVTMKAPDPTLYDPSVQGADFALSIGGAWAIPWEIPWEIGEGALDTTEDIAYTGSFDSYPVITVIGPITDLLIENLTTGDQLSFSGVTIAAADAYIIDCRYGYKTVEDNAGTNKIADLADPDDLATFRLVAPVDGSSSRTNQIHVTGSGMTGATNITLSYYLRYVGI